MDAKRTKNFRKYSLQQAVKNAETFIDIDFERRSLNKYSFTGGGSCIDEKVKKLFLRAGQARSITSASAQGDKGDDRHGLWNVQRSVRKSKTHDCFLSMVQDGDHTQVDKPHESKMITSDEKHKDRIINAVNFSEIAVPTGPFVMNRLCESKAKAQSKHSVIDLPSPSSQSLPSITKCIANRRLSLRKPKRGFRGLFTIRRNRQEKVPLRTKDNKADSKIFSSKVTLRPNKSISRSSKILTHAGDSLAQYFTDSDPPSDSSFECSSTLCEDVASLKSFDSLTGCGEIFADEETTDQLEAGHNLKNATEKCEDKQAPSGESFQGGGEQLASPGQTDGLELNVFWKNISNSDEVRETVQEPTINEEPKHSLGLNAEVEQLALAPLEFQNVTEKEDVEEAEKNVVAYVELGTPQSDHQESTSTSDEGYYDSFSPGHEEDESKRSQSPCVNRQFPRDSYSGDALYELFCDPEEPRMSPILDEEGSSLQNIVAQPQTPLSMYSFCVGAEENMAPSPTVDINCHEFFQGSWKGKECLLKLCDTELSLAMGLVNWLRQKTEVNEFGLNIQNNTENHDQTRTDIINLTNRSAAHSVSHIDGVPKESGVSNFAKATSVIQNGKFENKMKLNDQNATSSFVISTNDVQSSINLMSRGNDSEPSENNHRSANKVIPVLTRNVLLKSPPQGELNETLETALENTTTLEPMIIVKISKTILCPKCRKSVESNLPEVMLCSSCFSVVGKRSISDVLSTYDNKDCHSGPNKDDQYNSSKPRQQDTDHYVSQLLEDCIRNVASLKINTGETRQFGKEATIEDCLFELGLQADQQHKERKNIGRSENNLNHNGRTQKTNEATNNCAQDSTRKTKENVSALSPGFNGLESIQKIKIPASSDTHQPTSLIREAKEKAVLRKSMQCSNSIVLNSDDAWSLSQDAADELQYEIICDGNTKATCPKRKGCSSNVSESAFTSSRPSCLPLSKSVCSSLQRGSLQVENPKRCKKSFSHHGGLCFTSSPSSSSLQPTSRDEALASQGICGHISTQEDGNHKEREKSEKIKQ
ncbi:uncharacterized protein amer3 [Leucoraja erinacea]|uniref:uncharacterized protein amer3 n=1 Tax=Leucoraja erinaceus TaxID=7782 RepID=UPI0024550EC2|nr:uncharacterized protein amer3 [Leucoraja erinacea]XP_055502123.1 uncharacterized protein amer3 [Leucoraja erinacea]